MLQLALCVVGIYACFLTWGITQERVSTTKYDGRAFKYFVFLNLAQVRVACALAAFVACMPCSWSWCCSRLAPPLPTPSPQSLAASLVGWVYLRLVRRQSMSHAPKSAKLLSRIALVSLTQSVGPLFGYAALKHIDYPTMILGKSCKLVPVMLMVRGPCPFARSWRMRPHIRSNAWCHRPHPHPHAHTTQGLLVYRKSFAWHKYVVVALITVGVSSFTLFHHQDGSAAASRERQNSLYGLLLLTANLLIDGLTNSTQDHIFHAHRGAVTGTFMMVWMNVFSSALMGLYLLVHPWSGELHDALAFCAAHPASGCAVDCLRLPVARCAALIAPHIAPAPPHAPPRPTRQSSRTLRSLPLLGPLGSASSSTPLTASAPSPW
jgi:UDP-galactose transporter B1